MQSLQSISYDERDAIPGRDVDDCREMSERKTERKLASERKRFKNDAVTRR
jgi:hypothetical protein